MGTPLRLRSQHQHADDGRAERAQDRATERAEQQVDIARRRVHLVARYRFEQALHLHRRFRTTRIDEAPTDRPAEGARDQHSEERQHHRPPLRDVGVERHLDRRHVVRFRHRHRSYGAGFAKL
jgi:hypothetical protein